MARPRGKNSRLWRFSHTTVEVEQIFDKLSDDAMTKFNVHAVQVAANTLKKDVKAKFLERLPAADGSKRTTKSHYSDTLLDAVRQQKNDSAMARSNGQFGRTFVHILGVNASSSEQDSLKMELLKERLVPIIKTQSVDYIRLVKGEVN